MGHHLCLESLKIMIYITGSSVLLILFIQSLHRKIPTITIEEFYVPTLNKTDTKTTIKNTTIYFELKLYNKDPVGIYYRPMNLTFSYFPNKTTSTSVPVPLCVYTLHGFHQEHHKEKHVRGTVETSGMTVHGGGEGVVVMRVDLVGRVKFKSIAQWKRTVKVGVDVTVDEYTGGKVVKSGIHMVKSRAAPVAEVVFWIYSPVALLLVFVSLLNLRFL
ncbi:protein NDR1-like [Bidens hawaiensis]|uniref:protein NDR1-like n=1 Tax=Bidens hawaiensis TaxID=980011 RepID=UPI00404B7DEF